MKLPVRLRKTKLRQKKQRLQTIATTTAAPPARPRDLQQSSAVAKITANPTSTTKTERDNALQHLNAEIENAKNLPPAEASLLLRVAYFLRQVILNLDSNNAKNQEDDAEQQDATGQEARASDLTDASDGQNRQPNNGGSASANERLAATLSTLKKAPGELTAAEIRQALDQVEAAIEEGKLLLPADASLLQRVLNILKMALLELGGVEPELAVRNKDQLERMIAEKEGAQVPDAATQAEVTRAISDVQEAQTELAARGSTVPAEFPALMLLKQKALSDLSTTEIDSILKDIDRSLAESKLLLPENASRLQRALYILKMALLDLGHVDPKLQYEIQEQLKQIQQEHMKQ